MATLDGERIITLVGEYQARVGYRFINVEPPQTCRGCPLFQACVGRLEPGRMYEVVKVRDKRHPCRLHEGGVRVVEVVEVPITIALPSKLALEDLVFTFNPRRCPSNSCGLYELCNPPLIKRGDRLKVVAVLNERFKCPKLGVLVKSLVKRLPPS
ncbi:MAG: hypothetical protein DRN06_00720 [Thermoprotei archaeon]|nr:MAG: hypothetical protein DRN06_00720 [Thermoprotei archaeon]